jgi:hypothetical protein
VGKWKSSSQFGGRISSWFSTVGASASLLDILDYHQVYLVMIARRGGPKSPPAAGVFEGKDEGIPPNGPFCSSSGKSKPEYLQATQLTTAHPRHANGTNFTTDEDNLVSSQLVYSVVSNRLERELQR